MNTLAQSEFTIIALSEESEEAESLFAEIRDNTGDSEDLPPGGTLTINFEYRPGYNPSAHAFDVKFYISSSARSNSVKEGQDYVGLHMYPPTQVTIFPEAPDTTGDPKVWKDGYVTAKIPDRDSLGVPIDPHQSGSEVDDGVPDLIYYAKVSILQNSPQDDSYIEEYTGSSAGGVGTELPPAKNVVVTEDPITNTVTVTHDQPTDTEISSSLTNSETATLSLIEKRVGVKIAGVLRFESWARALISEAIDYSYIETLIGEHDLGSQIDFPSERVEVEVQLRPRYEITNSLTGASVYYQKSVSDPSIGQWRIHKSDGTPVTIPYQGQNISTLPQGTNVETTLSGAQVITLPNGQQYKVPPSGTSGNLRAYGAIVTKTFNFPLNMWGPSPPTGFGGSTFLNPNDLTMGSALLLWGIPADNGRASISEYQYRYRKIRPILQNSFNSFTSTGTVRNAAIHGLEAGATYQFEVRAKNSADIFGQIAQLELKIGELR